MVTVCMFKFSMKEPPMSKKGERERKLFNIA